MQTALEHTIHQPLNNICHTTGPSSYGLSHRLYPSSQQSKYVTPGRNTYGSSSIGTQKGEFLSRHGKRRILATGFNAAVARARTDFDCARLLRRTVPQRKGRLQPNAAATWHTSTEKLERLHTLCIGAVYPAVSCSMGRVSVKHRPRHRPHAMLVRTWLTSNHHPPG